MLGGSSHNWRHDTKLNLLDVLLLVRSPCRLSSLTVKWWNKSSQIWNKHKSDNYQTSSADERLEKGELAPECIWGCGDIERAVSGYQGMIRAGDEVVGEVYCMAGVGSLDMTQTQTLLQWLAWAGPTKTGSRCEVKRRCRDVEPVWCWTVRIISTCRQVALPVW